MNISKNKKCMLLIIILVLIASIVFAGCQSKAPVEVQQSAPEPAAVAPQPQGQVPEDLKGFIEYTIRKQLGEKSKAGKDRIRSVKIEDGMISIELNGNDAFTADMTVRGMLMDSRKLLEPLSKRPDVKGVSVSEYLDVEDIGGGTVSEWVFTLSMDKAGLDKVAGGDYLLEDLPKLAKEYKLHPNFNRE